MEQPTAQDQMTELALMWQHHRASVDPGQREALHDVDACWDGADQGIGLQFGSVCFRRRGCVRAVSVARGGRTQR